MEIQRVISIFWYCSSEKLVSTMGSTGFDIDKFTGSNDFGRKVKMHTILVQQGLSIALQGLSKFPATMLDQLKSEVRKKHTLILCLGDKTT